MKKIFRSIINIEKDGKPTIPTNELVRNYKCFIASTLKPEDPSFIILYTWLEQHFRSYKEMPSITLLYERSQADGNEALMANLKEIVTQTPYIKSDYQAIVKEKYDIQIQQEFRDVLTKTWQVVSSGLKEGEGRKKKELKGLPDALQYVASQTRQFRFRATGIKSESQIISKEDADEVWYSYLSRKKEDLNKMGLYFFLDKIDNATRGVKLGELWLIAAYVAQGKSTFTANLAYNGVYQGMNGLFIPLEMTFNEMRELIYTLHASNPIWKDHPKFGKLAGKLSYKKMKYGELNPEEEDFFRAVKDDLANNDEWGELRIHQPTEPITPGLLELLAQDYSAELQEKGKTLDYLIIDYVGLMVPDPKDRYGEYNADLNNIIRKLKNLALTFQNGRGLRVISPFQTNRDGWKEAIKNDGVYKLTALSNANEADRSSDLVMSLYMSDEMKRMGITKICCLKKRRDEDFLPFEASIDWLSMRISDPVIESKAQAPSDSISINEIPMD
jgi:replicative DNA helicase